MKTFFFRNHLALKSTFSAGFTLPELLVGVVLGAVVLAALGGSVLVSQMRISTKIRTDIERRDALNRAVALMRREIAAAQRITLQKGNDATCPPPNLYLEFINTDAGVCYSSQTLASAARYLRFWDNPWTGPCILTRSGPAYNQDNGKLEGGSIFQVVLDNMDACPQNSSSLIITPGQAIYPDSVLRDVDVEIRQTSNRSTVFSASVGSNPLYSQTSASPAATTSLPACLNGSRVINLGKLSGAIAFSPDGSCRNVYNLPNLASSYTIANCTYASCTVNGITLSNVDVLVFGDREIRP